MKDDLYKEISIQGPKFHKIDFGNLSRLYWVVAELSYFGCVGGVTNNHSLCYLRTETRTLYIVAN